MHEKKFSSKLQGSMSVKNRSKNHESNTEITAQNVKSSRRAVVLYGAQYVPVQYSVQHFAPHRLIVYDMYTSV